ncbi:hypothetical protein B0G84_0667 [Paraburkholderia sp. BL8N3]|nr:hypothetical protein [Paraburkholderia sp. BL8N3]TCK42387.1 hypothetical protein B0G84_0667 [Paraburkholderia sp. BL8N3]
MANLIVSKSKVAWELHSPHTLEAPCNLRWDRFLESGIGTKYQRAKLLSSARDYIEAVIEQRESRWRNISGASVRARYERTRRLVRWMMHRGLWGFSALTSQDIVFFLRSEALSVENHVVTTKTMQAWCSVFKDLWILRARYSNPLLIDMNEERELILLSEAGRRKTSWKPLDPEVAVPLLRDAMYWANELGPRLIRMLAMLWRERAANIGEVRSKRLARVRLFYKACSRSKDYEVVAAHLGDKHQDPMRVLGNAVRILVGAVIAQVLFLTGMRISEVSSLRLDCMEKILHTDGFAYSYLRGTVRKRRGLTHRWIVPQAVVDSLELVRQLFSALGERRQGLLFISYAGMAAVPSAQLPIRPLKPARAAFLFTQFANMSLVRHGFDVSNRPIHSHQGRKTFAKFVALRDKRSLYALAQHYGHVSHAITDANYVGTDIELAELLDESSREDMAAGLTDLITAPSIGGAASRTVSALRSNVDKASFVGKRAIHKQVIALQKAGVDLAPCDWGYCLYVEATSSCGGDSLGPSMIRRSPSVCADCANFAVTPKHRGWWEQSYTNDATFLASPKISEQAKVYVQNRLARTTKLLRTLNSLREDEVTISSKNDEEQH